jgi:hypothetical protein
MLPTDIFPDMELVAAAGTVTAESICIPIASIDGLTATEADPDTGDGRELLRALLTTAYANFATLPTQPTRMSLNYSENLITESRREVLITGAFNVLVPTTSYEMEAEPSA